MLPIAITVDRIIGRYVGALRLLDANGLGTDETLTCETPVRRTRREAIADATRVMAELGWTSRTVS